MYTVITEVILTSFLLFIFTISFVNANLSFKAMLQLRYWLNVKVSIPTTTITLPFCTVFLFVVTITLQTVLMNKYCSLQRH